MRSLTASPKSPAERRLNPPIPQTKSKLPEPEPERETVSRLLSLYMHATDFIQTAIEKAMSRQRSWDPDRSLFQNLWQVVSSEVNHAAVSYENKNLNPIDETVVKVIDYRENPEHSTIYRSEIDHLLNYLSSHDAD